MKVSKEEIDAAIVAYNGNVLTVVGRKQLKGMEAAINAALHVRRARKQAKHERQRKEDDKQVVESVLERKLCKSVKDRTIPLSHVQDLAKTIYTANPEWDGKFGVGEWEMRNGEKAIVDYVWSAGNSFRGKVGNDVTVTWHRDGSAKNSRSLDLIRPWSKASLAIVTMEDDEFTGASG